MKNSVTMFLMIWLLSAMFLSAPNVQLSLADGSQPGKALKFDGVDDYVVAPYTDVRSIGTFELWIHPYDIPTTTVRRFIIWSGINDWTRSLQLYIEGDELIFDYGNLMRIHVTELPPEFANSWHHLVVSWNNTMTFNFTAYIDGRLVKKITLTTIPLLPPGDRNLIGHRGELINGQAFNGTIDEVRVYNRTLTMEEVLEHYNEGAGSYGHPESGLVAGYHFDEGLGTIVYDYSSYGRHGEIVGPVFVVGHVGCVKDIEVVNVVPDKTVAIIGETININVTVRNNEVTFENFTVWLWYDEVEIGFEGIINLGPWEERNLTFTWDTTGIYGTFTLKANATILPCEINTENNAFVNGEVWIKKAPIADFTWSPEVPKAGEPITFNGSLSSPNGGEIKEYDWNFGDGVRGEGKVTTHIYEVGGWYNVTLNVTDSEGLTDSVTKSIYVMKRDVAVISALISSNFTYVEWPVNITFTVKNNGEVAESFEVNVYYVNETSGINETIATLPIESLEPGANITETITWDVVNVAPCINYTIYVVAEPLPGEEDYLNNTFINGWIKVAMVGDTNGDGKIDMKDVAVLTRAFGAYPGHPRWNIFADINRNGTVDMMDIAILARNFGKTCLT